VSNQHTCLRYRVGGAIDFLQSPKRVIIALIISTLENLVVRWQNMEEWAQQNLVKRLGSKPKPPDPGQKLIGE